MYKMYKYKQCHEEKSNRIGEGGCFWWWCYFKCSRKTSPRMAYEQNKKQNKTKKSQGTEVSVCIWIETSEENVNNKELGPVTLTYLTKPKFLLTIGFIYPRVRYKH